jgi:hypothetical protein
MVQDTRTKIRTDQLRALNQPREIQVRTTKRGYPAAIRTRRGWHNVQEILDVWRIDDEWWRASISRTYYRILLNNGHVYSTFTEEREDLEEEFEEVEEESGEEFEEEY